MVDVKILKNLYFKQGKTQSEIAEILNVSQSYISTLFIKLGIKSRRVWTKEDLEYLENKFGTSTVKAIAKHLKKSEDAIIIKAKRLGLGGITIASEFLNANQLASAIGIDRKTIHRWINKEGLKATKKVLAKERAFWRISINEFWKWAEKNQEQIKWSKFEKNSLGKEAIWVDIARKKHMLKPKREAEKWTLKEDESLKMYWSAGKSPRFIGETLNRSSNSILRRAARIGLNRRKIEIPWKPIEVETLIKMKLEGYTDVQVAEELGRGIEGVAYKRKMLIKSGQLDWKYKKATKEPTKVSEVAMCKNTAPLYHRMEVMQIG